jgi:hypothetical protein
MVAASADPQRGDRLVVDALAMAKVDRAEETAMVTEYQRGCPFPGVVGRTVEKSSPARHMSHRLRSPAPLEGCHGPGES